MYTVGSMFAGIGGICLGFKQNNCEIIWANEKDKYACETYRLNFGNKYLIEDDIKNINLDSIPEFDILTAGFPCQSFSSVGLQKGFKDPRGNLFFEIINVIKKVKPKVVFLENVANLVHHNNGKTISVITNCFKEIEYHGQYKIMNAKTHGNIPQQRNRIYIVAFKDKIAAQNFSFPDEIPLKISAFDLLDKEKQEDKYYLNDHKKWAEMMQYMTDKECIYRFTDSGLSKGMKGICPTLLAAMGSKFERIPFFYDNFSVRLMTPRECAKLQGFPDSYLLPDQNEKQVYKQIGNSVCVPVISRIAEKIIQSLDTE